MASRYPLVVNTAIPRIEELKGADDLNLSQSNVELSNGFPTALNDILRYNGTELEWISGDSFIGGLGGFTGVVRQTETQTLTNKTISGALNTLVDIPNSSLVNSFITFGTQQVFLGDTIAAIDSDTRYEFSGTSGGANTVLLSVDSYDLDNNPITSPSPNGNQQVTLTVDPSADLTLSYDAPSRTITLNTTFVDTNTTYNPTINSGISIVGTSFQLTGYTSYTSDNVLKWNGTQLTNSNISDDGTTITLGGDVSAAGSLQITDEFILGDGTGAIGPRTMFLRGGTNIGRGNANIDAVMSTSGTTPLDFARLFYNANDGGGNNSSWNILDEDGVTGAIGYIRSDTAPTSSTDTGRPGEIVLSGGNLYLCVAENTWVFAPVTTTF